MRTSKLETVGKVMMVVGFVGFYAAAAFTFYLVRNRPDGSDAAAGLLVALHNRGTTVFVTATEAWGAKWSLPVSVILMLAGKAVEYIGKRKARA